MGEAASVRQQLRVTGRVQGVGFRYFVLRSARALGLAGWVRNQPDGSVLCEVQGDRAMVDIFSAELRRGPEFSRVNEVLSDTLEPLVLAEDEFEIR